MNLKGKVKKLEITFRPKKPAVIVAHSHAEAETKLNNYYSEDPYAPSPTVLIAHDIIKPDYAGLSEDEWPDNR